MVEMDAATARQFRAACRAKTREQILSLVPPDGAVYRVLVAQQLSAEFIADLTLRARQTLEEQAEPDGTNDIVTCSCGAQVRVPGHRPCQCPTCKRRIQ